MERETIPLSISTFLKFVFHHTSFDDTILLVLIDTESRALVIN